MSVVRLGLFGVHVGRFWGKKAPDRPKNQPRPDLGQPQIATTRVATKYKDRRTKGLSANETTAATLCTKCSKQCGEYDKTLPMNDLWMWLHLMCPIKAIRRIRPNPAKGRSMDARSASNANRTSSKADVTNVKQARPRAPDFHRAPVLEKGNRSTKHLPTPHRSSRTTSCANGGRWRHILLRPRRGRKSTHHRNQPAANLAVVERWCSEYYTHTASPQL